MMLDATQPNGRHYYWKSEWLASLPDELLETFLARARQLPSPFSLTLLFQVNGTIGERPADATAVGNRDAAYNLTIQAGWDSGPPEPKIAWAREGWQAIRKFSTGGVYVNFLTEDEVQDRIPDAYRGNLRRLAAIKAKWDPTNFFQVNQNVKPG